MSEPILLVDDEEGIRKVLGISLTDSGYVVHTAANGEEALEIFQRVRPPIVLTDIKMPGMDGIELLKRIKQIDPETEVIMITGHGDMDLAVQSLKNDAADFVTKPIDDDVLEFALKRAREKISMRGELKKYTLHLEEMVREKAERLVRAERLAAVGQVVEGLSSALRNIVEDMDGEITFLNEMPCLVSIHNQDLKILAANHLFTTRLGNKIGAGSWEVYKGPSANPNLCPVAKTFESGKGLRSKERVLGLSGAEIPVIVHTAPIRNSEGQVELVLEISADMMEVKRLQEELWDTQAKYHQLFEAAPCYITVLDRDYRIQAANQLFRQEFGDWVGSFCWDVYRQREDHCLKCPVADTFKDGESHQKEIQIVNEAGEPRDLLINTAPIWDASDEIVQVMELATDITEIRRLQSHLSHLGLLIGTISHSIKGMLTGLDGGMYMVESSYTKGDEEQLLDGWETVKMMVKRIRSLALDILYYAKERDLDWENVDILSFAEDVGQTIRPKARRLNIAFIRDFDPSLQQFEIDPGVVRSALINILENAIDACLEDRADKIHRISFLAGQEEDRIIFTVTDNGIGMDKNTRDNLFNLFYSSKGSQGTGLGLFVSNRIIRQHGGVIEVESEPGQGSTFRIILPKILPEQAKKG